MADKWTGWDALIKRKKGDQIPLVLTLVKKKGNKCILYPKYLSVCEHGCTFAPEKITGLTILKGISTMIILNFVAVKLASVVKSKAVALMNK